MRTSGSAQELERRRRQAVAMLNRGYTPAEVGEIFGASQGAISRWRSAYREGGPEALAAKPHPGKQPKLDERQTKRLEKLLLKGARHHGWDTDLWTLPRIAVLIERHFGVTYDQSGVWHVLKRMNWSCHKPQRRSRNRDDEAIAHWRKVAWPDIKKSPK